MSSQGKYLIKVYFLNLIRQQSMAIKRPASAVAPRKNRGGSSATMMNNYSRGGNPDLSRTRPKNMLQDKVN